MLSTMFRRQSMGYRIAYKQRTIGRIFGFVPEFVTLHDVLLQSNRVQQVRRQLSDHVERSGKYSLFSCSKSIKDGEN